jgi:predicted metalloprotease
VGKHWSRRLRGALAVLATTGLLAGCAQVVNGTASVGNAPNADLKVVGDSGGAFDTTVKNSLSDVFDFWKGEFPKIDGGKAFSPLKGGLYSVDGLKVAETREVPAEAKAEACMAKSPTFIIDNGAFCTLDDSISWDRAPSHLFAQLAQKYGSLMVALVFAHEVGHAISYRKGIFDRTDLRTIDTESQADCAAGAWAAWALKGNAAHYRDVTPQKLDDALEGFLDGRDATPGQIDDISHGNGFDRLSAVADGIDKGASYCFSDGYFASRTFTERPFATPQEFQQGDNTPIAQILDRSANNPFVKDLNRFWEGKAKSIKKSFNPVKIAEATHPKCGAASPSSQFGYCPDDNTVYFDTKFADVVYNSLPTVTFERTTANVTLEQNQPGDFALGVMFSIAWGMAVRHQLFGRALTDKAALLSAVCYTGSYAKDVNVPPGTAGKDITLSPADLDEAVSAMLAQVGKPEAFGARDTTGLDRVQAFVKGYRDGLSIC